MIASTQLRHAAIAAVLLISGQAYGTTGNDLLRSCERVDAPGGVYDSGYCLGFIDGATDAQMRKKVALNFAKVDRSGFWDHIIYGSDYCVREKVTLGQMRLIFIKYARDHPQILDQPAEGVLEIALANAFPCPKP